MADGESGRRARPRVDSAIRAPRGTPLFRRSGIATIATLATVGALLPLLLPGYMMTSVITTLVFMLLAHAVGAIYTYLRLLMFGVGGFYAIGAYTIMLGVGGQKWPLWVGMAVAFVLPGLVALMISPLVFRLRGIHFALVTFSIAELLRSVLVSWQSLTGGWSGIALDYEGSALWFVSDPRLGTYWVALTAVILTTAGFLWFRHSPRGLRALALGDDLSMARALGVSPMRFQYGLFIVSGMLCGLAGAITALSLRFIDPSIFSATHALAAVTALIIGGWRVVTGPIIGAIAVIFLPELLEVGPLIAAWIYGGGLILAILLFPEGIGGTLADRLHARRVGKIRPASNRAASAERIVSGPSPSSGANR